MSDTANRFGAVRYIRGVIARWPGGAARIQSFTVKKSLKTDETVEDEDGKPVEEIFDNETEEVTVELVCAEDFVEPGTGTPITVTKSTGVNKTYVVISTDAPYKAGAVLKFSASLRAKQYMDYTVNNLG